ncbi:FIG01282305: hypothetical protein [hydrothermal vent metagenome]|uniref:Cytochrome c domain-containing protein n=1 Tax=hydrothermal vent metagenome TaxID=652676 RepID=A0A1W1EBQ0_9ZZZZ
MNNKKVYILALGLTSILLLSGCNDDGKEKVKHEENKVVKVSKIEVVKNDNAQEIKVEKKVIDKNQSKSYYYDYNNIKSEYDPNAKPANENASVRVKPRTQLDANMHVRSPYEKVQISLLVGKLSKNFRIKCSACHDDYANGIIGPSLLSRDADYIYKKIDEFKSGVKSNPLMSDLIKKMSNEEIRTLADEIYIFNQEIKKMKEKK